MLKTLFDWLTHYRRLGATAICLAFAAGRCWESEPVLSLALAFYAIVSAVLAYAASRECESEPGAED